MDTKRQQRMARLVQKETGEIFHPLTQQLRDVLVSVILVRVISDLNRTRIYPSIFPSGRADELLKHIQDNAGSYRYELGQHMGQQLRVIPEMEYYIDDSLDYPEHADKLPEQ